MKKLIANNKQKAIIQRYGLEYSFNKYKLCWFIYWKWRVEFLTVVSIKKKIYLRVLAKRLFYQKFTWYFLLISGFLTRFVYKRGADLQIEIFEKLWNSLNCWFFANVYGLMKHIVETCILFICCFLWHSIEQSSVASREFGVTCCYSKLKRIIVNDRKLPCPRAWPLITLIWMNKIPSWKLNCFIQTLKICSEIFRTEKLAISKLKCLWIVIYVIRWF